MNRGRPPTWTPADVLHLRWYAERGFSMNEAAAVMGKTYGAVINKASELEIRFHGMPGAPFMNRNNSKARVRESVAAIMGIPSPRYPSRGRLST